MGGGKDAQWLAARAAVVEAICSRRVTGKEVMERLGISSGVLGGWCRAEQVRRQGTQRSTPKPGAAEFAQVTLVSDRPSGSGAAVVLLRGGRRVRVGAGFDAGEVVRLVRALESC